MSKLNNVSTKVGIKNKLRPRENGMEIHIDFTRFLILNNEPIKLVVIIYVEIFIQTIVAKYNCFTLQLI